MLIGEIAKRSGLSKDTLRHYEALGLIHSTSRQAGSRVYRDYDARTLERLSLVAFAKLLGLRLREMVEPLDRALSNESTAAERKLSCFRKFRRSTKKSRNCGLLARNYWPWQMTPRSTTLMRE